MIVLNVGGEGERPDAIDLNSLVSTLRRPNAFVRSGRTMVGDFLGLPIRTASIDEVWGRMVPLRLDLDHGKHLASEAFRVLRPGGTFRVQPSLPPDQALRRIGRIRLRAALSCGRVTP